MYGVENWEWENQEGPAEAEIGTIRRVCCVECEEDTEEEDERVSLERGYEVWRSLREEDNDFQRGYEEEDEREERRQQERDMLLRDEYEKFGNLRGDWEEMPELMPVL